MSRVLRARYFPDGDILKATIRKKASYAWKSIIHGKELIIKGMRFVIGDGKMANMWTDSWLNSHPPRPPMPLREANLTSKVSDYLNSTNTGWNITRLQEDVVSEDVERIMRLKVSSKAKQDLLGWHYNDNGLYSVKSGYWLASHLPDQTYIPPTYGSVSVKQKLWKTRVPTKIKHFLWRISSRSIATGNNLKRRHITQDVICKRCWMEEETEEHLFFHCPYAKQIWSAAGVTNSSFDSHLSTYEDKLLFCLHFSTSSVFRQYQDLPIWILWRIWKSRNLLLYQQKSLHWKYVLSLAKSDAREWSSIVSYDTEDVHRSRPSDSTQQSKTWTFPPVGWMKCNVDAGFQNTNEEATAGWIFRDSLGVYQGAVQAKGFKVSSSLESEFQAILMAIQDCWRKGYRHVIMESDCKQAMEVLNDRALHFAFYNWIREIRWWSSKFLGVKFQWIPREANKVADTLARTREVTMVNFTFHCYVPSLITNLLHEDYVRAQG